LPIKYDPSKTSLVLIGMFVILQFLQKPAKKPIIAAITGYAVGQGLDLALWCDLRFVEENVLMGFYNRRFGNGFFL
jgi:Enoyl-CoA hydratase/carnithine racemase